MVSTAAGPPKKRTRAPRPSVICIQSSDGGPKGRTKTSQKLSTVRVSVLIPRLKVSGDSLSSVNRFTAMGAARTTAIVAARDTQRQFRFTCLTCSAKNNKYEGMKTTKFPQCPLAPMSPAVRPTPRAPNSRDRALPASHRTRRANSNSGASV